MSDQRNRTALELIAPAKVALYDDLLSNGFWFGQNDAGWYWEKGNEANRQGFDSLIAALDAAAKYTADPKPLAEPDFTGLIACCIDRVKEYAEGNDVDSDLPHYIYEAAMTAVYGNDIFKHLNKRAR